MKTILRFLTAVCAVLAIVPELSARIISYAPVSDQYAVPAVQSRLARHYLLMESKTVAPLFWGCQITCPTPANFVRRGELVLYDSRGLEAPRVVLGGGDPQPTLVQAAMWEGADERPRILILSDARINGDNPERATRLLFSRDAGATWTITTFAAGSAIPDSMFYEDVGGPIARQRGSQIRLGNADVPFVFSVVNQSAQTSRIYAMHFDGTPRVLVDTTGSTATRLIGSDREGNRFLVTSAVVGATSRIQVMDLSGGLTDATIIPVNRIPYVEGWITPSGGVYVQDRGISAIGWLTYSENGSTTEIARAHTVSTSSEVAFFAIPTHDFHGAWVLSRGPSLPTALLLHQGSGPLVEQWHDSTAPQVEALHTGSSGQRLLIQVHRPRPMADAGRLFIDPALAIWEVGQPAPRAYHELFLIEGPGKGFVHLDVERVAAGEGFVFDSSSISTPPPPPPGQISSGGGGGDVVQEWGVVRASLQQRLVLPGISRVQGAYGSLWRCDVTLRNPSAEKVSVAIRYVPSFAGMVGDEITLELAGNEIRVVRDALKALFDVEVGGGAFFITPQLDSAVHVTSRTYTDSPQGTYGMGAGAIDIFAAAGPRFPVSFSGALQGQDFRTNVIATDVSGRGTGIDLQIADQSGIRPQAASGLAVPPGGQSQFNSVTAALNVGPWQTGALLFRPATAEAIASVIVIDNRTNDPTYFPPDLPAPYVRTIPVIGHVDGANESRFRSDLFLYNPSDEVKTVILAAKLWDAAGQESRLQLTLLPHESKVIKDVLFTAFGKTGLARLRYQSGTIGDSIGIRATSRTYTLDPSGATYGLEIPPLNSFQSAGAGDTLEILGAFGETTFRTNLALVELSPAPTSGDVQVKVEVVGDKGATLDSFEVTVPRAGGIQLNDLFRERGLLGKTDGAVLRISPLGGSVGAFATSVDNGTNDPTYLGAVLGSR